MSSLRSRAPIAQTLAAVWLGAGVSVVAAAGCAIRVTPPAAPHDPTSVFIADYGRHASLILPAAGGSLREYAYGEWEWFALGHTQSSRVGAVLFWPTRGTLGRADLKTAPEAASLRSALLLERVYEIRVARRDVERLRSQLDARFAAHRAESHGEPPGMVFVPDDRPYSISHQCNDEVSDWLRKLGCRVRGRNLIADYRIEP